MVPTPGFPHPGLGLAGESSRSGKRSAPWFLAHSCLTFCLGMASPSRTSRSFVLPPVPTRKALRGSVLWALGSKGQAVLPTFKSMTCHVGQPLRAVIPLNINLSPYTCCRLDNIHQHPFKILGRLISWLFQHPMNVRVKAICPPSQKGSRSDPVALLRASLPVPTAVDPVKEESAPTKDFLGAWGLPLRCWCHGEGERVSPVRKSAKPFNLHLCSETVG